jgi:hypothetical protein
MSLRNSHWRLVTSGTVGFCFRFETPKGADYLSSERGIDNETGSHSLTFLSR